MASKAVTVPPEDLTEDEYKHVFNMLAMYGTRNASGCLVWGKKKLEVLLGGVRRASLRPLLYLFFKCQPSTNGRVLSTCGNKMCVEIEHLYDSRHEESGEQKWHALLANSEVDEKTSCILWLGAKNTLGYGHTEWHGKGYPVHRLAYILRVGDIAEGLRVRHDSAGKQKCTAPTCFNVDHLSLGDAKADAEDRKALGRIPTGEKVGTATISEALALQIKHSRGDGTQRERSAKFGVSHAIVRHIDHGLAWSHLPDKNGIVDKGVADARAERQTRKRKALRDGERVYTEKEYEKAWARMVKRGKVDPHPRLPTPCLLLPIPKGREYAGCKMDTVERPAHIISAEYWHNDCSVIENGLVVRHLCGVGRKGCVARDHLTIGTRAENSDDSLLADESGSAILQVADVREIKRRHLTGEHWSAIASAYPTVHPKTVYNVARGHSWSSVEVVDSLPVSSGKVVNSVTANL